MKQKVIKFKSRFFKREVTIVIDEKLNNLKMSALSARKLQEANEELLKYGHMLPK